MLFGHLGLSEEVKDVPSPDSPKLTSELERILLESLPPLSYAMESLMVESKDILSSS